MDRNSSIFICNPSPASIQFDRIILHIYNDFFTFSPYYSRPSQFVMLINCYRHDDGSGQNGNQSTARQIQLNIVRVHLAWHRHVDAMEYVHHSQSGKFDFLKCLLDAVVLCKR